MSRRVGLSFREELGFRAKPGRYKPTEGDAFHRGGTVHYRLGRKPKVTLDGGGRRK